MILCVGCLSVRPERECWPDPEPDFCNLAKTGVRNRIDILQSWPDLAVIFTEFGISSSVVLSNTIICNFHSKIS